AMPEHHPRLGPLFPGLAQDPFDLLVGHRIVRGVVDRRDPIVAANGAQEYARAPSLLALHSSQEIVDVEGLPRQMRHPPERGGNSATSSPSCTGAFSFTWRRFSAASGRGGMASVPGNTSRTLAMTSATVAGVDTVTADDSQPASSA